MKKPTIQLSLNSRVCLDNIKFYNKFYNIDTKIVFVSRYYNGFENKKIIIKTGYKNGLVTLSKNIINIRIYKDSDIQNNLYIIKNKKRIPIKKFKKWVKPTSRLKVVKKIMKKQSSSSYNEDLED